MKSAANLTPLGAVIKNHLKTLGWSGNELARRSGLSSGTVSRLMRGLLPPTHQTVEKMADALQIDALQLKEVAGLRTVIPPAKRDARVEYIAQRLNQLPPDVLELAVDLVGAQVDAIYELSVYRVRRIHEGKAE